MTIKSNFENFDVQSDRIRIKESITVSPLSDEVEDIKTDRTVKKIDERSIKEIEADIETIKQQRANLERNKSIISAYKSMCIDRKKDENGEVHISFKV